VTTPTLLAPLSGPRPREPERVERGRPLGVVVVGAGRFGEVHLLKLMGRADVRVCAVVDPEFDRARRLAAMCQEAVALGGIEDLSPAMGADIALVATPISALAPTAQALLEKGLHCLVEKPGADTARAAARLTRTATLAGRRLAIGFVERFNAGLAAVPPGATTVVIRRVGPGRPGTGPLALDWGIHDVDLARHLLGPSLSLEQARASSDALRLRLREDGGGRALIVCERGHPRTRRRLWVDGVRVDLAAPGARDALSDQWSAFLSGVRGGPVGPLANGTDAIAALSLVEALSAGEEPGARAAG